MLTPVLPSHMEHHMLQALRRFLPGSDPVPPQWVADDDPDWKYTKDQWFLEQFFTQLIFVADDMKQGGRSHSLLTAIVPGGQPSNPFCYTHTKFLAYKRDLGPEHSSAIIMPPDYQPSGFLHMPSGPAKVQGELYCAEANKIYLLDKHMRNGVKFSRQRVKITYPWRYVQYGRKNPLPKISPHSFITITAWMYVGIPRYWDPMIGGVLSKPMDLREHDTPRPWIGEFYKLEFNR